MRVLRDQLPLCAWWLSRFRFGPVEWIWHGQPLQAR